MQISKGLRYALSVLSGILLAIAFPHTGSLTPLVFVGLVPLLLVEHSIYKQHLRSGKVYVHGFITFLIYNTGAVWWLWYSTDIGAILAFVANALLMTTVFYVYHLTKRNLGRNKGFACLFFYWLGFEYIHTFWELSWPWLAFGNIFTNRPEWVQWYSVTGFTGGTLWVLLTNYFLFRFIYSRFIQKKAFSENKKFIIYFPFVLLVPIVVSYIQYYTYQETGKDMEVVVVQPNIDPYEDKFSGDIYPQLDAIFDMADSLITPKTAFVLAPETALPYLFLENQFDRVQFNQYVLDRKSKWGTTELLIGANTMKLYDYKRSTASMKSAYMKGMYEEYYNTALLIDEANQTRFIHKSKLVLGVEKIPFVGIFPFLQDFALENGGTSATLGTETSPQVFKTSQATIAPVVCYESIYGEFVAEQVRKGAEFIAVITNDGWWDDSPGYRQHLDFSRLRAIESRKYVARSANTGISAFINQRGDIIQQTEWWVRSGLRQTIKINSTLTIYDRVGDVLGKVGMIISMVGVVMTLFYRRKRKENHE